jgi:hypothetical protein
VTISFELRYFLIASSFLAAVFPSCTNDASNLGGDGLDGGADTDSDNDADGDSDSDQETDTDSETGDSDTEVEDSGENDAGISTDDEGDAGEPYCEGALVGDHCWYLGDEQGSCEETCADHGGFDEATRGFAGSDGSDEHCALVLDALDASGSSVYPLIGIGAGIGCSSVSGARYRVEDETTTPEATYVLARRACACAE